MVLRAQPQALSVQGLWWLWSLQTRATAQSVQDMRSWHLPQEAETNVRLYSLSIHFSPHDSNATPFFRDPTAAFHEVDTATDPALPPIPVAPKKTADRIKGQAYLHDGKTCIWGGHQWYCEHNRMPSLCKECGGSGLCKHSRQRSQCKICGGFSRKKLKPT